MINLIKRIGLIIFISNYAYGMNQIDSLTKKLNEFAYYDSIGISEVGQHLMRITPKQKQPLIEIQLNLAYGRYFLNKSDYKKSFYYYDRAKLLAEEYKNDSFFLSGKIGLGKVYLFQDSVIVAKQIFLEALNTSKLNRDTANMINCYQGLADIHFIIENAADSAMNILLHALSLAEKSTLINYQTLLLYRIGQLKSKNKDLRKVSIETFKIALGLAKKERNDYMISIILNEIANSFLALEQVDSSLFYYNQALFYARKKKNWKLIAMNFANIAYANHSKSQYDIAKQYIDSATHISKNYNLSSYLAYLYVHKGRIYLDTFSPEQAIAMSDSALVYVTDNKENRVMVSIFHLKYMIYERLDDSKKSLFYYKKFISYRDSIHDISVRKKMVMAQAKYDTQKKESQLLKQKVELAALKTKTHKRQLALITTVAFLVILFLIYYNYTVRSSQKKEYLFSILQTESIDKERNRIAKELHDNVGSSLSLAKIKLEKSHGDNNSSREDIIKNIDDVLNITRNIAYQLYPAQIEKISLKSALAELVENTKTNSKINTLLDFNVEYLQFSVEQKNHIYRIIQECITNTIKHANAENIIIVFNENNGGILFEYKDDGKGLSSEERLQGFGFNSMKQRAQLLGGILVIKSDVDVGLKLIFTFPFKA